LTHRDDGHGTVLLFLRLGAWDLASLSDDRRMRTMRCGLYKNLFLAQLFLK
jgi:hypothetical protein